MKQLTALVLLWLLVNPNAIAQKANPDIKYVRFQYDLPNTFTSIKVTISSPDYTLKILALYSGKRQDSTSKKIDKKDFELIVNSLKEINPTDLMDSFSNGLDGTTTTLSFGDYFNKITYSVWNINEKKEPLKDFVTVVKLILKYSDIKWERIY